MKYYTIRSGCWNFSGRSVCVVYRMNGYQYRIKVIAFRLIKI